MIFILSPSKFARTADRLATATDIIGYPIKLQSTPAAMAEPITPAILGAMACMSK